MNTIRRTFKELKQYPTAIGGLVIIGILILVSIITLIVIPYDEAVRLWRGGEDIWYKNPKYAAPIWINAFRSRKLSESMDIKSELGVNKEVSLDSTGFNRINIDIPIDYQFDAFPQDLIIYFDSVYKEKLPYVSITWLTPDEREIRVVDMSIKKTQTLRLLQETKLTRRLQGKSPEVGLFIDPNIEEPTPLKGTYHLKIEGFTFEPDADINAEFVIHGQLHGIAGTDHLRRDITIALLWGTPVALSFGLLAALGTSVLTMIIAAIGTWYGGWVDELIQRITEVNLLLPFLPILIMISTFYSKAITTLFAATILLSIFTGGIKTYRSIFLQVKESPYIEAARTYGASSTRVIFQYLIPRIVPLLIPQLVTSIPGYVFLEASLAVLGLGDPVLPTWGKVINDAQSNGALYQGQFYWVLEPAILLVITGLAFAMLGFALDRIFNPRLRGL